MKFYDDIIDMGNSPSRPVRRVRAPNTSAKSPAKSPFTFFKSPLVNTKRPRGVPSTKKANAPPNHRDFRSPLNPNVYIGRLRRKTQGLGLSPENANAILEVDRELINEFRDPRNLSLDMINRFIERHYELISEDRATRVVGDSRRKMSRFEFNNDDNFEVMHSSASCLWRTHEPTVR